MHSDPPFVFGEFFEVLVGRRRNDDMSPGPDRKVVFAVEAEALSDEDPKCVVHGAESVAERGYPILAVFRLRVVAETAGTEARVKRRTPPASFIGGLFGFRHELAVFFAFLLQPSEKLAFELVELSDNLVVFLDPFAELERRGFGHGGDFIE